MASVRNPDHTPSQTTAPRQAILLKEFLERDPFLQPYAKILKRRIQRVQETESRLTRDRMPPVRICCRS